MNKKFISLYLLILITLTNIAHSEFNVKAKTAILQDYLSGEILYEKEADHRIYPASMTKIMTTIIAFDLLKSGETSLDEMIKLYEDGVKLTNLCKSKLDEAENRITTLINEDGKLKEEPGI